MTLLTSAEATPLERCDILAELVTTFARVPVSYLRAMSTPIVSSLQLIKGWYTDTLLAPSLGQHRHYLGVSL